MLKFMFRHHRRMGVFVVGMTFFFGVALISLWTALPVLYQVLACLFAAGVFVYVAIFVIRFAPRFRTLLEVAGFAGLGSGLILETVPFQARTSELIVLLIFVGMIVLSWALLYGPLTAMLGKNFTSRVKQANKIPHNHRQVWKHLIPGEAAPEEYSAGTVTALTKNKEEPDTLHLTFKTEDGEDAHYDMTILAKKPPSYCRVYFLGSEPNGNVVDGVYEFRLIALNKELCKVITTEERIGLTMPQLIERWFDDVLGIQHHRVKDILSKGPATRVLARR